MSREFYSWMQRMQGFLTWSILMGFQTTLYLLKENARSWENVLMCFCPRFPAFRRVSDKKHCSRIP